MPQTGKVTHYRTTDGLLCFDASEPIVNERFHDGDVLIIQRGQWLDVALALAGQAVLNGRLHPLNGLRIVGVVQLCPEDADG